MNHREFTESKEMEMELKSRYIQIYRWVNDNDNSDLKKFDTDDIEMKAIEMYDQILIITSNYNTIIELLRK